MLALAIMLQACANVADQTPSYLGMPEAAEAETDAEPGVGDAGTLRHVPSNKILGAMAYQKVTGNPVDASRLSGEK